MRKSTVYIERMVTHRSPEESHCHAHSDATFPDIPAILWDGSRLVLPKVRSDLILPLDPMMINLSWLFSGFSVFGVCIVPRRGTVMAAHEGVMGADTYHVCGAKSSTVSHPSECRWNCSMVSVSRAL